MSFPTLNLFADAGGPPSAVVMEPLVGGLLNLLRERWRAGEHARAEDLLSGYPDLSARPEVVANVLKVEVELCRRNGVPIEWDHLPQRFPKHSVVVRAMAEGLRIRDSSGAGPRFPKPGDLLGDFRLLSELGRGALGRVYLAEQTFLGDRPVILKVTPRLGQEYLKLARIQHTHVVPLYAARDFPDRDLRVLVMPCLGGTTFDRLIGEFALTPLAHRTGADFERALAGVHPAEPMAPEPNAAAWRFLRRATYEQAVCWLAAGVADALHDAHEEGMLHLDLKPSNVLLTSAGHPMLLDFHLARPPIVPGDPLPGWVGGTHGYMPPEQERVIDALRRDLPVADAVDARADVFALGLLLKELMGRFRHGDDPCGPTRAAPPHFSVALADLIARCLHPDPAKRYPSAHAVADDLRRHINALPLDGVRNRSVRERWAKWRRRKPRAVLWAALAGTLAAAVGLSGGAVGQQVLDDRRLAREQLAAAERQLADGAFAAARAACRAGVAAATGPFAEPSVLAELTAVDARAAHREAAAGVAAAADVARTLHSDDRLGPVALAQAAAHCRAAWDGRAAVLAGGPVDRDLQHNLIDLALLAGDLAVRAAAPAEQPAARRAALARLDAAEAAFGPRAVIDLARQLLRQALGEPTAPRPGTPRPATAWELTAIGRCRLAAGNLDGAVAAFDEATEADPAAFWPHFGRGVAEYRRGRWAESEAAFGVCLAVDPNRAACPYNRALARVARNAKAAALRDFDLALKLDPTFGSAAVNRGVLHLALNRPRQALADFDLALTVGAAPAPTHYNRALALQALDDLPAARRALLESLRLDPTSGPAQSLAVALRAQQ